MSKSNSMKTKTDITWINSILKESNNEMGISSVDVLDGYLAAVIVAPNTLNPSQWLSRIWDEEKEWKSEAEFSRFFSFCMERYNALASARMGETDFKPALTSIKYMGETKTYISPWCLGFMHGSELLWPDEELEKELPGAVEEALDSIAHKCSFLVGKTSFKVNANRWTKHLLKDGYSQSVVEEMINSFLNVDGEIENDIRVISDYYLAQVKREMGQPPLGVKTAPSNVIPANFNFEEGAYSVGEPKIGRNDPCTCGSGKKAKKCCHK